MLGALLRDKDTIARMADAGTLVDPGNDGKMEVQSRLAGIKSVTEKLMLQDSLDMSRTPHYGPILEYPLSDAERRGIRGCK